jgi:hypothetical protein
MLGIWKKRKPIEIRPPTYALIDDFQGLTDEFYREIEDALIARELPGLEISRIDLREGNRLSSRREYLRLRRERLTFDVCSAPFGTSWFFCYRLAEIPAPFFRLDKVIVLGGIALLVLGYVMLFGAIWGGIIIGLTLIGLMLVMKNALTLGLHDFDAWLLAVPILGRVYEEWFRGDSYHRRDTREMWGEMMDRILQEKIKQATAAQGIEHVQFIEAQPDAHPMLARLMRLPVPSVPAK